MNGSWQSWLSDNLAILNRAAEGAQGDGIAGGGTAPYDGEMEARLAKLESDIAAMKIDIAVIKANGATESDVADAKTAIAEAKSSIITWAVTAIFIAQLLPALLRMVVK
jgi:hypothetical protein